MPAGATLHREPPSNEVIADEAPIFANWA